MPTLTINNLGGPLTRRENGDLNSGFATFKDSWGYNPFAVPGTLTWMEQPTSILSLTGANSVIGAILPRVNGNVGNITVVSGSATNNVFDVLVNDTGASNANLDSPSLIGTLAVAPNPARSAALAHYGANIRKLFYGDDDGLQKASITGTQPQSIYGVSSVTTGVPRPLAVFQGKLYFGNGTNIGEIDTTEVITTGTKLSPALPIGTVVRDLDVTPDGNYLQILSTATNPTGGFQGDPAAGFGTATESFAFLWNGIDAGVTAVDRHDGIVLTANQSFGQNNYLVGYDPQGAAIYAGQKKLQTLPDNLGSHPTATFSTGNMLGFMTPEYSDGKLVGALYNFGPYDGETPPGLFRLLRHISAVKTDVKFVNAAINVSNRMRFPSYSAYTDDIAQTGKIYFATHEASADGNADSRGILWKFFTSPTGTNSVVAGVYQTQTQLFSKKIKVKEVRLYTNPLTTDNAFSVDLIGSGGSILSGGSQNFRSGASVGGTVNVINGTDLVQYNPAVAPTYALGVRITNSSVVGTRNWSASKIEIDWEPAGK